MVAIESVLKQKPPCDKLAEDWMTWAETDAGQEMTMAVPVRKMLSDGRSPNSKTFPPWLPSNSLLPLNLLVFPSPERGFGSPRVLITSRAVLPGLRMPIYKTKIAPPVVPWQGAGIPGRIAVGVARHAEIADPAARPLHQGSIPLDVRHPRIRIKPHRGEGHGPRIGKDNRTAGL